VVLISWTSQNQTKIYHEEHEGHEVFSSFFMIFMSFMVEKFLA